jgi:hypothetical protein
VPRPGVAFRPVTLHSEAGDLQPAPRADGAEGTGAASDGATGDGTPAQDDGNPGPPLPEDDASLGLPLPEDDASLGLPLEEDGASPGPPLPEDGASPRPPLEDGSDTGPPLPEDDASPGPPLPVDGGPSPPVHADDLGLPLPEDGGNPGFPPLEDGGSPGLPPEDGSDPGLPLPEDGGDPSPPLLEEGGDPGLPLPADAGDPGPLPAPATGSTRPHAVGRHRRRRVPADKASHPRLHGALTALAGFLVIVTVVLVTTDNGAPPAPAVNSQQPGPVAEPDGQIAPPPNWKLAFSTDFPGTALDTSTWAQCYPWSPMPPGCSNFGNADEREWYLPSQVHVDNGTLALVAQRTPTQGSDENGNPKTYTCRSGMVTTYPSVHLKYGFVQVTARLPFGKGLWPAIWLIPADQSWPPEIDIVEHWDTQPTASATLHYGKQNSQERGTVNFPDADKGWHTYTLYWTQSRITIYYDNQLALTTTAHIPQQSMYLLLDLADENDTPGSCSGTMYVKSVNIWKPPPTPATG